MKVCVLFMWCVGEVLLGAGGRPPKGARVREKRTWIDLAKTPKPEIIVPPPPEATKAEIEDFLREINEYVRSHHGTHGK